MARAADNPIGRRGRFRSLEDQAYLTLQRTAERLFQGMAQLVKPAGLSPPQYTVLRILRAARPRGLSCREIAERMITRDPDITRLLDRLEDRGLVARSRERADRRVITARITPAPPWTGRSSACTRASSAAWGGTGCGRSSTCWSARKSRQPHEGARQTQGENRRGARRPSRCAPWASCG
jgi:hypothetical protein